MMTILKSGGGFTFGISLFTMNHEVISNLLFRDQFSRLLKLQISKVQNKYFHLIFTKNQKKMLVYLWGR